jgi:hypothetical protein
VRMRGVEGKEVVSETPRIGDSGISSKGDEAGLSVVGDNGAIDRVDNLGEGTEQG